MSKIESKVKTLRTTDHCCGLVKHTGKSERNSLWVHVNYTGVYPTECQRHRALGHHV